MDWTKSLRRFLITNQPTARRAGRVRGRSNSAKAQLSVEALENRELLSGFPTSAPAYLLPLVDGVTTTPLLTVGDIIDRTGNDAQQYRMVGIPDGLGAFADAAGNVQLFMNHELRNTG